jgi:hypothetical protein
MGIPIISRADNRCRGPISLLSCRTAACEQVQIRGLKSLSTRPLRRTKEPPLRSQPSRDAADVDEDQRYRDANDGTNDRGTLEPSKGKDDRAYWNSEGPCDPHTVLSSASHGSKPFRIGHVITNLFYSC